MRAGALCLCIEKEEKSVVEEKRIALIGIVLEDMEATEQLNSVLHAYSQYIIGRECAYVPPHPIKNRLLNPCWQISSTAFSICGLNAIASLTTFSYLSTLKLNILSFSLFNIFDDVIVHHNTSFVKYYCEFFISLLISFNA